ncbi:hypothetical protein F443_23210, partial [Phytophthora nicotianae P1569]
MYLPPDPPITASPLFYSFLRAPPRVVGWEVSTKGVHQLAQTREQRNVQITPR